MRHHSLPAWILALAVSLLAGASMAQAGIETWVSATGVDSGTCPITAPCRTFAFAHNQTNGQGAINVLSSGNFGPLTITKPISIVAQGVEAIINTTIPAEAGAAGIIVQAGAAAIVSLRGLTIDLRGTGDDGIRFVSGAALHLHDSFIRRAVNGILFAPADGTSELHIADTVVADTTGFGLVVRPTGSASVVAMVNRARAENGQSGFEFSGLATTGAIAATVRDSMIMGTREGTGIIARDGSGGTTTVMLDHTAVTNNSLGVRVAGTGATILIGNSTVTGNANGLVSTTGVMQSYGTNKVSGNTIDGTPSLIGMQ
jgi:hypothetical protein